MSIFEGYSDSYDADARLTILRALKDEPGHTLNDNMLLAEIKRYGFRRGTEYLFEQLFWLEKASAVKLHRAGTVIVTELAHAGVQHLTRDKLLFGIKPPSQPR